MSVFACKKYIFILLHLLFHGKKTEFLKFELFWFLLILSLIYPTKVFIKIFALYQYFLMWSLHAQMYIYIYKLFYLKKYQKRFLSLNNFIYMCVCLREREKECHAILECLQSTLGSGVALLTNNDLAHPEYNH